MKRQPPVTRPGLLVSRNKGIPVVHDREDVNTTEPTPSPDGPWMVFVCGYAGTGKSHAADRVASALGAALLDKDTLTRPLVEELNRLMSGDPDDRHSGAYLRMVRPAEYRCLMSTGWENVRNGLTVVLSAPFTAEVFDRAWHADLIRQAAVDHAVVKVIWIASDVDDTRARLVARGASRDQWKLTNWIAYRSDIQETLPASADAIVRNTGSVSDLLNAIDGLLAGWGVPPVATSSEQRHFRQIG